MRVHFTVADSVETRVKSLRTRRCPDLFFWGLSLWLITACLTRVNGDERTGGNETTYDPQVAQQLAHDAMELGSADRGLFLFTDQNFACIACHRIAGEGGSVGPDLTDIGQTRSSLELTESLLWPNRTVADAFVAWTVTTLQGLSYQGYLQPSDGGEIKLFDAPNGQLHSVAASDVETRTRIGSLMPAGITTAMSRQQQLDLLRFLIGLRGPTSLSKGYVTALQQRPQAHVASEFPWTRAPQQPMAWSHHNHPVNRDRVYDFYAKEAEYFRQQKSLPRLLPPFPGLDGGTFGHWGNQAEADWADGRWNQTDLGWRQAGIMRWQTGTSEARSIARGVAVRLGDQQQLSACYDQDAHDFAVLWSHGFVKFSDFRAGFLDGMLLDGKLLDRTAVPAGERAEYTAVGLPSDFSLPRARYRGYYRYGHHTLFAYEYRGQEYLDGAWVEQGRFQRTVALADKHPLAAARQGGPRQWPQVIDTPIVPGTGHPYAIDTIELPRDNPWKALLYCGGHDFLSDGSALICTMQGDVWRVTGLDADPTQPATAHWSRYASGLHHPLGLVVVNDQPYVLCRDQLMRLQDLNDDGEADFYESISQAFVTSTGGHDFLCGLERDAAGRFYFASGNQGLVRLSADGETAEVLATGLRNPDGLGLLPDGTVTIPASEGEWTPTSMICALPPDATIPLHFGYRGPVQNRPPALPLLYLPRGVDNSAGGQVYVESERWGPLGGQLIHLSFGTGTAFVVLRDAVGSTMQGAAIPLPGDFRSGIHRGRFRRQDGQLYVTGMDGWGTYTPDEGCFQRMRYTDKSHQIPVAFHTHSNGIVVKFAEPIDSALAQDRRQHFAQCWNYRYSEAYGSAEYSPTHYGIVGHDPLLIRAAHVLADGRSLFLEIPDLQPVNQLHLQLRVNAASDGTVQTHDLYLTVNALDAPYTDIPDYVRYDKLVRAHPLLTDLAAAKPPAPNRWEVPIADAQAIVVATAQNLQYAQRRVEVQAGQALALTFKNADTVPHNWVLLAPGGVPTVGELANRMIADPQAVFRHYVPDSKLVLFHTPVVGPAEASTIYFHAPSQPGRYPYLCTFPGHWMAMQGELIVKP